MVQSARREIDWEHRWSTEAQLKQLPSLHGIVSKFGAMPGMIGMHGGLPPSDSFPFSCFTAGITAAGDVVQNELQITDPALVAAAQQYNMNAQGYAPLVSWAHDMVSSLHRPATLQPAASTSSCCSCANPQEPANSHICTSSNTCGSEPIGMKVVITQGSSAALEALFRMLLNPGDPVLLEEYTYAHVVEADLLPMRCELLPIRLDAQGLLPSHLDQILNERQAAGLPMPRVLYTIPTGQNPTGSIMSRERMEQVYAVASKWDLVIIEDDAYYWLQYPHGQDHVPGLKLRPGFLSLDVDGRVVRLDTLAKLLGPGFRLGWLSGPPELAAKFALYTAGTSIGANMLSQVMIHQLLSKWGREGFEAFVTNLQRRYANQAAVACAAAAQHLTGLAEWRPVNAGMFMWLKMTGANADSSSLVDASAAEGVMIIPGHLIAVKHLEAAAKQKQRQKLRAQTTTSGSSKLQLQQQSTEDSQPPQDQQYQFSSSSTDDMMQQQQEQQLPPCPYFRCSFVTVGPESIQQGFARLRKALLALSGPQPYQDSARNSQYSQSCNMPAVHDEIQPGVQQAVVESVADQGEVHRDILQPETGNVVKAVENVADVPSVPDDTEDAVSTSSSCSSSDLIATVVVTDVLHNSGEATLAAKQQTSLPAGDKTRVVPSAVAGAAGAAACVVVTAAAAAAAATCICGQQQALLSELPDVVEACEVRSPCVQQLLGVKEGAAAAPAHVPAA